jgi:exonuclease VII large subunit
MNTPVITAVGHAGDHPFIQSVADRSFDTPSALGTYLRQIALSTFQGESKERSFIEREKQYQQEISGLKSANAKLQKENKDLYKRPPQPGQVITKPAFPVGWLIVGLIIGALIMYLLRTLI